MSIYTILRYFVMSLAVLTLTRPAFSDEVFVGAGDVARCGTPDSERTARLLDQIPGIVFSLGDHAYPKGTARDFSSCYGPTWGRHKSRTRPVPGNHEYMTAGASAYLDYFGRPKNYSFTLGDWHIVALDSNCQLAENGGSCGLTSPTMTWLQTDLAANPAKCTLVFFHHPRWSSGSEHGNTTRMAAAWKIMYKAGVDVVLSGHAHSYERFAPLAPDGTIDWAKGIRSFVVGTGGSGLTGFKAPISGSQVRNGSTYGVLKLTLKASAFDWEFVPVAGETFTDTGTELCH
jgi:3',5'-cyclic AMP phosphodiesterase CpdA